MVACTVTPKSVPPKIGPAGLILAGKSAKTGPPRTTFAAKLGPAGPILAAKMVPSCQNQSPMGDRFWQKIICQNRSSLKVLIPAHTWLHGCSYCII